MSGEKRCYSSEDNGSNTCGNGQRHSVNDQNYGNPHSSLSLLANSANRSQISGQRLKQIVHTAVWVARASSSQPLCRSLDCLDGQSPSRAILNRKQSSD